MAHLTTTEAVASYLGQTLDGPRGAQADALLGAVDVAISRYTDRDWLGGPIVGEVYVPEGPLLYLRQRPVASIEQVAARWYFAPTPTVLTVGAQYRVRDLARGVLLLSPWRTGWPTDRPYDTLEIDYTPAATVPADIALAATMLVAEALQPALGGAGADVRSYSVGQELTVTRFDRGDQRWPPQVRALLDSYRGAVFA